MEYNIDKRLVTFSKNNFLDTTNFIFMKTGSIDQLVQAPTKYEKKHMATLYYKRQLILYFFTHQFGKAAWNLLLEISIILFTC